MSLHSWETRLIKHAAIPVPYSACVCLWERLACNGRLATSGDYRGVRPRQAFHGFWGTEFKSLLLPGKQLANGTVSSSFIAILQKHKSLTGQTHHPSSFRGLVKCQKSVRRLCMARPVCLEPPLLGTQYAAGARTRQPRPPHIQSSPLPLPPLLPFPASTCPLFGTSQKEKLFGTVSPQPSPANCLPHLEV